MLHKGRKRNLNLTDKIVRAAVLSQPGAYVSYLKQKPGEQIGFLVVHRFQTSRH